MSKKRKRKRPENMLPDMQHTQGVYRGTHRVSARSLGGCGACQRGSEVTEGS